MSSIYKNITTATAAKLRSGHHKESREIQSIRLANVHASDSVSVNLYARRNQPARTRSVPNEANDWTPSTATIDEIFYILKGVTIPYGVTLILNKDDIAIADGYALYIKLSASDSAVDVSIVEKKNSEIKKNKHDNTY